MPVLLFSTCNISVSIEYFYFFRKKFEKQKKNSYNIKSNQACLFLSGSLGRHFVHHYCARHDHSCLPNANCLDLFLINCVTKTSELNVFLLFSYYIFKKIPFPLRNGGGRCGMGARRSTSMCQLAA